jgi:hypothetical protein
MKLNATSEMIPVTWPEFANNIHPGRPSSCRASAELDRQLRDWLCQATGYAGISLQPNAGSQGEYAGAGDQGLLARRPGPPRHSPDSRPMAPTRQRADGRHDGGGHRRDAGQCDMAESQRARTANAWPA